MKAKKYALVSQCRKVLVAYTFSGSMRSAVQCSEYRNELGEEEDQGQTIHSPISAVLKTIREETG